MVSSKKDPAARFREALDDLTSALKANYIGPIRDQIRAHEFPEALVAFLKEITRLPTDDPNVQGWTRLYAEGRQAYERAQVQVFSRKSEA